MQKDIAEGKVPPPSLSPPKKKRKNPPGRKPGWRKNSTTSLLTEGDEVKPNEEDQPKTEPQRNTEQVEPSQTEQNRTEPQKKMEQAHVEPPKKADQAQVEEPSRKTEQNIKLGSPKKGEKVEPKSEPPHKSVEVNIKKETHDEPKKIVTLQPPNSTKPNPVEKESTYTSMYSKKEVPKTIAEWNKLKTSCAMMLSSGTKGTSKVSCRMKRACLVSFLC